MARTTGSQMSGLQMARVVLAAVRRHIGGAAGGVCRWGRTLALARSVWLVVAVLASAMFVASTGVWVSQVRRACPPEACVRGKVVPGVAHAFADLHLAPNFADWYHIGLSVVFAVGFASVAALIFWRRSRDLMGLYLSLALLVFGLLTPFENGQAARLVGMSTRWQLPVEVLQFAGASAFGIVGYIFPDGRFVPRWTRLAAVAVALWFLPAYLWPDTPLSFSTWPGVAAFGGFACLFGVAGTAQVYRYLRISTPGQRQQTKWVVFGILVAAIGYLAGWLVLHLARGPMLASPGAVLADLAGGTLVYVSLLQIPLCIGIAILRYHLFDIDVIIRRTLIYGVLTGTLAVIYVGTILGAQAVVQAVWGRRPLPPTIVVASTLLIVALFRPLRRAVQATIDRRFYRRKYDAARTVMAFGQTLLREVDLTHLTQHLLAVVEETVQPSQASLWLIWPGARLRQSQTDAGPQLETHVAVTTSAAQHGESASRVRVFAVPDGPIGGLSTARSGSGGRAAGSVAGPARGGA